MTKDRKKDRHRKDLITRTIRFEPDIYKAIQEKAKLANVSVNEYVNLVSNSGELEFKYNQEDTEKIRKEIISLHRTFNQWNTILNRALSSGNISMSEAKMIYHNQQKLNEKIDKIFDLFTPNMKVKVKKKSDKLKQFEKGKHSPTSLNSLRIGSEKSYHSGLH